MGILLSSCEKKDNSVIDPVLKFPVIDTAGVSPNVFDTSNVSMSVFAHVVSEDVSITKVSVRVLNPASNEVNNIILSDTGNGRYTGQVNFSMDCRYVGTYRVEFTALNNQNLYSNAYPVNFNVINSHDTKPVLAGLVAPDSLLRPQPGETTTVFLQVTASDPDGSCDINSVFFNSFKPDGTPASGNPFSMYDDGNSDHCDQVAGDNKFSLCIIINNQALLGNYQFKFNAKDNSGLLSDTLTHQIYVHN